MWIVFYLCCTSMTVAASDIYDTTHDDVITGLDTYFFPNLSVGQPSNNMDLSEIEIYLGTMMIFFLFRKKIGENCISVYSIFISRLLCLKHIVTK